MPPKTNALVAIRPELADAVAVIEAAENIDPAKINLSNLPKVAEFLAKTRKAKAIIEDAHKEAVADLKAKIKPLDDGKLSLTKRATKADEVISDKLFSMYVDSQHDVGDEPMAKRMEGVLGSTISFVTKDEITGELTDVDAVPEEFMLPPAQRIDYAKVNAVLAAGVAVPGFKKKITIKGHIRTLSREEITS